MVNSSRKKRCFSRLADRRVKDRIAAGVAWEQEARLRATG